MWSILLLLSLPGSLRLWSGIPEDLQEAMDDREGWRERVRKIHADGAT